MIPFNVTSSGSLGIPDMLAQTTLRTPKEHCISLSSTEPMEQATEVVETVVILAQLPQLDVMLYCSEEQSESTEVQLNTNCLELVPTNWTIVGGGRGSINLNFTFSSHRPNPNPLRITIIMRGLKSIRL